MQKKFSKIIALVCTVVMSAATIGCGGMGGGGTTGGNNKNKVQLVVETDGGGLGVKWLEAAAERFQEKYKDYNWGKGADGKEKIGVVVQPTGVSGVSIGSSTPSSGTAIFDVPQPDAISSYVNSGWILNINDIMTDKFDTRNGVAISIDDKIDESAKSTYKVNGEYYAAPSIEYYPGFAYKKNLFAHKGFYFASAQNETDADKFTSTVLNKDFYFAKASETLSGVTGLSCGPDGEFGTDDDGLPSSLYELIALCEKMEKNNVEPIDFTGKYSYYSPLMLTALAYNLAGYENAQANYTFKADELEIVTGFTNENLFPGYKDVKKPTTKKVKVTEETGYYTSWSVANYYAEAFMKLCEFRGWFGSSVSGNRTQREAISNLVFSETNNSDANVGMHVDGSFWYNEATLSGYWDKLDKLGGMGGALDRAEFGWMSLPVSYSESVTEGNGRGQVLADIWQSILVINKNVEDDSALMAASKAFLQFISSDSELSAFTSLTTVQKSLDYDLTANDYANMNAYGKNLWEMTRGEDTKSKVLYFAADNATFTAKRGSFMVGYTNNTVFNIGTSTFYQYITNNATKSQSLESIFRSQARTKEAWESLYSGTGTIGAVDGLTSIG